MNEPARKIQWAVWGGLILTIAAITGTFVWSRVAARELSLPVLCQIPDFALTNQNNQAVSMADLRGKVWVADIIFTRCPGPCARMTRRLADLQAALPADMPMRLVTFTSDPEYDTPPILKRYAERFGANSNQWWFLTGDKGKIRGLAVNDLKFVVVEKKPGEREAPDDLFIHSTWFVLVDAQGRVRGWTDHQGQLHAYFDSADPDALKQVLTAIRQLNRET
jgi:protein SCO1